MSGKPSANSLGFAAVGAALVALRFVPADGASDAARLYGWLGAGAFALAATQLALSAITAAERRPSPWPSRTGRIAWALRPRGFMLAWAVIALVANTVGTPHLAVTYPPRACVYAGWAGLVTAKTADCPWWTWLRRGDVR